MKKFHQFLYGRKFRLITDHKPLLSIFSPEKQLPVLTAQRLQRYAIILMNYQFDIQYKSTKDHGNADGLSRLSTQTDADFDQFKKCKNAEILCNIEEANDGLPITFEHVRNETLKDSTLQSVLLYVQYDNWPKPSRLTVHVAVT